MLPVFTATGHRVVAPDLPGFGKSHKPADDAPFPDATFKGGVRRFPNLVPDNPDAEGAALSRRAREWFRTEWAGRTFEDHGQIAMRHCDQSRLAPQDPAAAIGAMALSWPALGYSLAVLETINLE